MPVDPLSDWRSLLAAPEVAAAGLGQTDLGLLFELREQLPRTPDRWRGPTARTAKVGTGAAGPVRLAVRPVIRRPTGNWARGGLTWATIGYQVHRLGLDLDQLRWFTQFAALHRATRDAYAGQDVDWFTLDEFASPLLWPLLAEARELGIALVSSAAGTGVRVGDVATVALDLTSVGRDITMAARLEVDGTVLPLAAAGAIGAHGVYTYRLGRPT